MDRFPKIIACLLADSPILQAPKLKSGIVKLELRKSDEALLRQERKAANCFKECDAGSEGETD